MCSFVLLAFLFWPQGIRITCSNFLQNCGIARDKKHTADVSQLYYGLHVKTKTVLAILLYKMEKTFG